MTSQLEQRIAECREVLDETAFLEDIKVEKDTLIKRLEFLQAVMSPQGSELSNLIRKYEEKDVKDMKEAASPKAGAEGTVTATSWRAQLANAPPCQSFAKLTTAASWKDSLDKYWACQSTQELKEFSKERASERKPIVELNAACNAGLKELKKAINNFKTRMQKTMPKASAKNKGNAGDQASILFEKGVDAAKAIPVISMSDAMDSIDFAVPLVVKLVDEQLSILRSDSCLSAE